MAWNLIDRPKTIKVTKKLAREYSEMEAAPNDRPLSERRLAVYQRLFAADQFRPVTWASAICKETGDLYRVNGKHTSTLLAGMDQLPEFWVTIEEYECDTLEDVAKLYGTFDSAMQQRSSRDIYLSFAGTVPELTGVSTKVINVVPGGICYAQIGEDIRTKSTAPERAELLLEYPNFTTWCAGICSPPKTEGHDGAAKRGSSMLKQPVIAAMFLNWQKSVKAATEFWTAVRDETGAAPNLADRRLSRYLVTTGMRRDARTARTAVSNREVFVKCLHAWNAWRKGETTNLNYYAAAKVPAVS